MQVVLLLEGVVGKVLTTPSLRAYQTGENEYTLEGETLRLEALTPERILILEDEEEIGEGETITQEQKERGIPIERFLAVSPERAAADALGLMMRQVVAEGAVSDEELLRVAPALEARAWLPGLMVAPGDVYSHGGSLYRCVQAHTTQADWRPEATPALWRRVQPRGDTPPWQPNTDYGVGDVAGYPDSLTLYICAQAHTSLRGWEPPNVPALWKEKK
ncbi:MAG: hypothetical protein VB099_20555 [Candidatus Limiplasma sp.]|nr:hypothetical protein [Candidatus Limiplasma sp.]